MSAQQPDLLDHATRTVAPTSLDQWDRIKRDLPLKDLLMVAHVDDYLRAHAARGYTDVTGRVIPRPKAHRPARVTPFRKAAGQ